MFSNEVAEHISKIIETAIDIQTYTIETESMPPSDEKIDTLRKCSESKKWLYKQINEKELNSKIGLYMKIAPKISWYQRITSRYS